MQSRQYIHLTSPPKMLIAIAYLSFGRVEGSGDGDISISYINSRLIDLHIFDKFYFKISKKRQHLP